MIPLNNASDNRNNGLTDKWTLSLRSMSRRLSRLHECTPCRSIPSASPCRCQAKIERAQIVLDRSQPGLPGSSGSASPVFGRTPNAGLESSGMVLIGICMTEVTKELGIRIRYSALVRCIIKCDPRTY